MKHRDLFIDATERFFTTRGRSLLMMVVCFAIAVAEAAAFGAQRDAPGSEAAVPAPRIDPIQPEQSAFMPRALIREIRTVY
jgi:hypothetical protein